MSFAPYFLILLVLLLGSWLYLALGARSRALAAAPVIALLVGLLVLILQPPDGSPAVAAAGWAFEMSRLAWRLSVVALGLGLAAALTVAVGVLRPTPDTPAGDELIATGGLLVAAALPTLWAGNLFTQTAAYALFGLVWLIVVGRHSSGPRATANESVRAGGWLLAPVMLTWLAAATAAAGQSRYTLAALLAAAWFAAGAWPLTRWRDAIVALPHTVRVVAGGLPVVLAAGLLAPQVEAGRAGQAVVIVVTVLALVGLAFGLRPAWERPMTLRRAVDGLAPGLAGLVVLAAVWLDEPALMAAVRLAVFLPALLLLVVESRPDPDEAATVADADETPPARPPLRLVALGLGCMALAGLPLTVGFGLLAPLYGQWGSGFRVALLVALALLLALWLAAAGWLALRARATRLPLVNPPAVAAGLLPVLVGLLWFDPAGIADASWLTWAALVIPAVAGLALVRLLAGRDDWRALLREALTFRLPVVRHPSLRRAASAVTGVVNEASAILEGNGGLLWLLALLSLFYFLA